MTYPDDWQEIATRVKRRAGWRCVRCGHKDHPMECNRRGIRRGKLPCDPGCDFSYHSDGDELGCFPEKQRVLTVHHLDGDKSNVRWWNLAPLCQVCHLAIQGKVAMEQTYSEPHSDWFLPYVAGYYVETIEGLEVSRSFVEARLAECLAIGQPHLEEHYRERLAA